MFFNHKNHSLVDLEIHKIPARKESDTASIYRGFLKWWYPTTMGFPIQNDHFGVFWGYHHFRKPPYIGCFGIGVFFVWPLLSVRRYDASSATTGAAIADSIGSQAHAEWRCKCCGDKGRFTPRENPANDHRKPKHLKMDFLFKHVIVQLAILIFGGPPWFFFGMKHHAANLRPFIWMHFFKDVRV